MTYILFLAILFLSAITYWVIKPFDKAVSLETIFFVLGTFVSFLPVLFMMLLIWAGITGLIAIAVHLLLEELGALEIVVAWPIWAALPRWGWTLIAISAVAATGNALLFIHSLPKRGLSDGNSKL